MTPKNQFVFDGQTYQIQREFKENKWYFTVYCEGRQIVHPKISTTISDTKHTIAEFDREHGDYSNKCVS